MRQRVSPIPCLAWNPLTVLSLLSIHWILFRFLSLEKKRQERVRDTLSVKGTNTRDRDASSSQEQKELLKGFEKQADGLCFAARAFEKFLPDSR